MALPWKTDKKQYRTQGSYRFSQEQRNSYFLYLDIKIVSYVHTAYENFKSVPPNGFWGYSTIFCGSTPTEKKELEFPNQRVVLLQGRDNLNAAIIAQTHKANIFSLESLAISLGGQVQFVEAQPPTVVGFPETVVKFKGFPLCQFEFSCYWLRYEPFVFDGVLFESDDPTDGEDEYQTPKQNPIDDPYQGNEQPSEPDDDSDERDYGEDNEDDEGIVGVFSYEFATNEELSTWNRFEYQDIKWPGQLQPSRTSQFDNAISWIDFEGNERILTQTSSRAVAVRFVQILGPDGTIYVPEPNRLEIG